MDILKHYVDTLKASAVERLSKAEAEKQATADGVRLVRSYFRTGAGIAGRETAETKLVKLGALKAEANGATKNAPTVSA
jgi:hypothetical protein